MLSIDNIVVNWQHYLRSLKVLEKYIQKKRNVCIYCYLPKLFCKHVLGVVQAHKSDENSNFHFFSVFSDLPKSCLTLSIDNMLSIDNSSVVNWQQEKNKNWVLLNRCKKYQILSRIHFRTKKMEILKIWNFLIFLYPYTLPCKFLDC